MERVRRRPRAAKALYVGFSGEPRIMIVSVPQWDAQTQTVLVDGMWDLLLAHKGAKLIFRNGMVYEIEQVQSSGLNRATATVKYRYGGIWAARMRRTLQPPEGPTPVP